MASDDLRARRAAVYPLRPGRPRVWRLKDGRWAWECSCAAQGHDGCRATWTYEARETHELAIRAATRHARTVHDPLERLFQLPPFERTPR